MKRVIILFDGVCNLCNSYVNFVIDHDRSGIIKFAALQSDAGHSLIQELAVENPQLSTVVFVEGDKYTTESTAILRIAQYLEPPLRWAKIFLIIPPYIRNFFYRLVARNRYKLFGKKESCRIPTPELRSRFL